MKKVSLLDKLGTLGALLSAAACPACFPLLAVVGSVLGLGVFARWEGYALYALQGFVLLGMIGNILSYRVHRAVGPLVVGILAPIVVFFALHAWFSPALIYIGLFGLAVAAVWNVAALRRCTACARPILKSVMTCPRCGLQKEEVMPIDACQYYYECPGCKVLLKPKAGDCCVFCSYGTVKCPLKQEEASCQAC